MPVFSKFSAVPTWAALSLIMNGVLFIAVLGMMRPQPPLAQTSPLQLSSARASAAASGPETVLPAMPQLGETHRLDYQHWLDLLRNEAAVAKAQNPERLTVLIGDSLSLWFPYDLMPRGQYWLNQGLSGEKTEGILDRLELLDGLNPDAIFIMAGINDLVWGRQDSDVLNSYDRILARLQKSHPDTPVVVQSVLPHGAAWSSWESRDRLLVLPNERIRKLNRELEKRAIAHGAYYLDLYPLFADSQGDLRQDLSTDGLHLNRQGYLVWSSAIQLYDDMYLK